MLVGRCRILSGWRLTGFSDRPWRRHGAHELALAQNLAFSQNAGSLDDVSELTHVAGPWRVLKEPLGGRGDAGEFL